MPYNSFIIPIIIVLLAVVVVVVVVVVAVVVVVVVVVVVDVVVVVVIVYSLQKGSSSCIVHNTQKTRLLSLTCVSRIESVMLSKHCVSDVKCDMSLIVIRL